MIIDEAGMWKTSDEFLSNLKKFQAQVSSLWVALGFVNNTHNFDEPAFRKRLKEINFYCPTLKHCLRNGQAIMRAEDLCDLSKGILCESYEIGIPTMVDSAKLKLKSF